MISSALRLDFSASCGFFGLSVTRTYFPILTDATPSSYADLDMRINVMSRVDNLQARHLCDLLAIIPFCCMVVCHRNGGADGGMLRTIQFFISWIVIPASLIILFLISLAILDSFKWRFWMIHWITHDLQLWHWWRGIIMEHNSSSNNGHIENKKCNFFSPKTSKYVSQEQIVAFFLPWRCSSAAENGDQWAIPCSRIIKSRLFDFQWKCNGNRHRDMLRKEVSVVDNWTGLYCKRQHV